MNLLEKNLIEATEWAEANAPKGGIRGTLMFACMALRVLDQVVPDMVEILVMNVRDAIAEAKAEEESKG